MAIEPVTREERFLAAAGGQSVTPPTPITRKEQLLQGIIDAVKSGGATPDVIEGAVNDYLNANPVKPGATTEQAAQIEQNKNDIADLQTEVDELKESGGNGSGQNAAQVEPAWGDTPKVFFGAPLQKTKDDAVCQFWYYSKSLTFTCWVKYKAQGNSTLGWPKKNQTVKLYKDEACTEKLKINFKGWGKQNKFVIKAYWRDLTHARDVGSVRLESECAKSRPGYDTMPEQLRTSPNMGGIDGFPVLVWADGVYQGRYMWNIPKDAWMANMDNELDTHCILCSEDYNSSCFRAAANINGNDWTDEIHNTVPASIKNRWNEVISFVRNSSDEEFVANLDSYIDVESLIDRHLVGLVSCDFDGYGKNQMYMTYDGQKWYAVPYDKDGTWGVFWTGNSMLPSNYGRNQYEDMTQGRPGNLLFIRLEQLFWQQLQERWAYLRNTTLSVANIIARMRELTDIVPPYIVAEDYAPTTAGGAFTGIPNKDTCTIQQIQQFAAERHTWTDEYVAGLTPVVPVPCEGITLSAENLAFTAEGTQTLTATVTPENTTDAVLWSSDNTSVANVSSSGVVTAVQNGTAAITATCGAYSATCAVTVEGIGAVEPVYSLAQATTFNGTSDYVDTGVKLYDTEKDWTILMAADFTQCMSVQKTALHCVHEVSPWPGVNLYLNKVTDNAAARMYNVGGHAGAGAGQNYLSDMPATATKLAIRCTGGKIDKVAYLNAGEVKSATPTGVTYTAYDGNLLLGCYQDTSGKKDRFWQGSISQCDVYFAALSDELISAFLV